MVVDVNAWDVGSVQKTYPQLHLSAEQAALVYQLESQQHGSGNHYFSDWEWWDYELSTFRDILDATQLEQYLAEREKAIAQHEAQLREGDAVYLQQVQHLTVTLRYYEEIWVPGFFRQPPLLSFFGLEQHKINFLKAEYQQWLQDQKTHLLISHFRQYKTYQPNRLQAGLLLHRLHCLFPESSLFVPDMDAATKAVADYLVEKLSPIYDSKEAFVQQKLDELKTFTKESAKKYYNGEEIGGWHVTSETTDAAAKQQRLLNLILLERSGYKG